MFSTGFWHSAQQIFKKLQNLVVQGILSKSLGENSPFLLDFLMYLCCVEYLCGFRSKLDFFTNF